MKRKVAAAAGGALFIAVAAAIVLFSEREVPPAPQKQSSALSAQAFGRIEGFSYTKTTGGRTEWEVRSETAELFREKNLAVFENGVLTFHAAGGRKLGLFAHLGRFHTDSRDIEVEGNVIASSDDGYRLLTNSLRYEAEGRQIATAEPVLFFGERLQISGSGLRLWVEPERLALGGPVEARLFDVSPAAPEATPARGFLAGEGGPIRIAADALSADHKARRVVFSGNVSAARGAATLTADELAIAYAGAEGPGTLEEIVARGGVVVHEGEREVSAGEARYRARSETMILTGAPWLRQGADRIAGARIEMDLAAGRLRAQGSGAERVTVLLAPRAGEAAVPAEEGLDFPVGGGPVQITSDRLDADEGSRLVRFAGRVLAVRGASVLSADDLEIRYAESNGGREIDRAIARGDVRMQEGDRRAACRRAEYLDADRRVILTGEPELWQGEDHLAAPRIEYEMSTSRLAAARDERRRVVAVLVPRQTRESAAGPETSPEEMGLLSGGKEPVRIEADALSADRKEGWVLFTGDVAAVQGDSSLDAQELEIHFVQKGQGEGRVARADARRDVRLRDGGRRATCAEAIYLGDQRQVLLSGSPEVWEDRDRIRGETIVYRVDTKQIQVEGGADGKVRLTVQPKRGETPPPASADGAT